LAGNLCAFVLFVSPIPTFRRIIRNKSTEQFSGLPYIYSLFNCLICCWYGLPFISPNIILVATTNSFGAIFQFVYLAIFIAYTDRTNKLKMSALLGAVLTIFAAIAYGSLRFLDSETRQLNLVIKTRSVEYMPFFLSFATFLMSVSFSVYGLLKADVFIYVPNGIGTVLGVVQLALYYYYRNQFDENSTEPLLEAYV
ncbi:Bidirectional sugar transporter SWEET2a, partial [Linum grandiflorum]